MSKFFKLFLALIILAGCSPKKETNNLSISTQNGEVLYTVEEAQTPEELETGLMNRDNLPSDRGMIFDLSLVDNKIAMWMKDTLIPLDMLFVDADGKIFFIHENATPMSEELIIAPAPAIAVIELNAGDVQKYGIKTGDSVKHRFFQAKPSSSDAPADEPAEENPTPAEETASPTVVEEAPSAE